MTKTAAAAALTFLVSERDPKWDVWISQSRAYEHFYNEVCVSRTNVSGILTQRQAKHLYELDDPYVVLPLPAKRPAPTLEEGSNKKARKNKDPRRVGTPSQCESP